MRHRHLLPVPLMMPPPCIGLAAAENAGGTAASKLEPRSPTLNSIVLSVGDGDTSSNYVPLEQIQARGLSSAPTLSRRRCTIITAHDCDTRW